MTVDAQITVSISHFCTRKSRRFLDGFTAT